MSYPSNIGDLKVAKKVLCPYFIVSRLTHFLLVLTIKNQIMKYNWQ